LLHCFIFTPYYGFQMDVTTRLPFFCFSFHYIYHFMEIFIYGIIILQYFRFIVITSLNEMKESIKISSYTPSSQKTTSTTTTTNTTTRNNTPNSKQNATKMLLFSSAKIKFKILQILSHSWFNFAVFIF